MSLGPLRDAHTRADRAPARIAIVTGGSMGLGKALCLQLQQANYRVIEFSRTAPNDFSVRLDLAAPESVPQAVEAALKPIDAATCTELLLINNAGTLSPMGPAWRGDAASMLANLNTNVASAVLVIAQVMKHFRDTPGRKRVVHISSGAALKGYAGWSLYCAGKAAMEGFIRAVAVEERTQPHPFVVISVDPGVVDTGMQALIRATPPEDFPEVARFIARGQAGGLAAPEAVAEAILRLLAGDTLEPGGRHEAPMAS